MQVVKDMATLEFQHRQGGQFRWITISTLLLAVGTILHLVSPSVGGVTPNWSTAAYGVAICLTRPSYKQGLGIGLVAALINMLTSKSGFPYGNLLSEPVGALTCTFLVHCLPHAQIKGKSLLPSLCGFIGTFMSGLVFVSILKVVMNLPMVVYFTGMIPLVAIVGVLNALVTPVLYFPALRLFVSRGLLDTAQVEKKASDHSQLVLKPTQEGLISLEHVSYIYNRQKTPVLQDVQFTIQKGDFLVLTGASGSGKSSVCKALTGAIPHFCGGVMHGMVFVDGVATTQTTISKLSSKVGYMLDDYDSQLVAMTVEEEIAFSLENHGVAVDKINQVIDDVLEKVQLSGYRKRTLANLSGGQRQRLVIASILALNPEILVLDEPTSALDPEGTKAFYELLHTLNVTYGHTIIVVEQDLNSVLPYANRLVLLDKGRVVSDGTVEQTLRYMYRHKVYDIAIPPIVTCRFELEKLGVIFDNLFISIEEGEEALQQLYRQKKQVS